MLRLFYNTCHHRIIKNIIHFLNNKSSTTKLHWLVIPASGAGQALPPKLIIGIPAILLALLFEYPDHPVSPAFRFILLYGFDNFFTGKFFEIPRYITQISMFCRYNYMYMIVHDTPAMQ